jgi:hypothetical protein
VYVSSSRTVPGHGPLILSRASLGLKSHGSFRLHTSCTQFSPSA